MIQGVSEYPAAFAFFTQLWCCAMATGAPSQPKPHASQRVVWPVSLLRSIVFSLTQAVRVKESIKRIVVFMSLSWALDDARASYAYCAETA